MAVGQEQRCAKGEPCNKARNLTSCEHRGSQALLILSKLLQMPLGQVELGQVELL